jgi:hypothetical protein
MFESRLKQLMDETEITRIQEELPPAEEE